MSGGTRSKLLRAFVVLGLSFVAALGGAEAYLRLFDPVKYRAPIDSTPDQAWGTLVHRRSAIPGLLYELAPDVSKDVRDMHVETNALGMRGPMPAAAKDASLLRIAAIGDSVTFGFSVDAKDAWPAVLERELNERAAGRAHRYEVLNFGVGGYSTRDEAIVVEQKALALQPDLIVVGYFLNDPDFEPNQLLHRYFRGTAWWEHSHLLRLLARWRFDRERNEVGGDLYRYYHDPRSDRWKSVLDGFDSIRRSADSAHVRVLLVVFPVYVGFESWTTYGYADLHARVLAEASRRRFATLDLVGALAKSGLRPDEVSVDPEHPNAVGQRIAAEAILESIVAEHDELLHAPF